MISTVTPLQQQLLLLLLTDAYSADMMPINGKRNRGIEATMARFMTLVNQRIAISNVTATRCDGALDSKDVVASSFTKGSS